MACSIQEALSPGLIKEGANSNLTKFNSDKVLHVLRKSPLQQQRGGGFFEVAVAWRVAGRQSAGGV